MVAGADMVKDEVFTGSVTAMMMMMMQEKVKACELELHEKEFCVQRCQWGCGESIGPHWVSQ